MRPPDWISEGPAVKLAFDWLYDVAEQWPDECTREALFQAWQAWRKEHPDVAEA